MQICQKIFFLPKDEICLRNADVFSYLCTTKNQQQTHNLYAQHKKNQRRSDIRWRQRPPLGSLRKCISRARRCVLQQLPAARRKNRPPRHRRRFGGTPFLRKCGGSPRRTYAELSGCQPYGTRPLRSYRRPAAPLSRRDNRFQRQGHNHDRTVFRFLPRRPHASRCRGRHSMHRPPHPAVLYGSHGALARGHGHFRHYFRGTLLRRRFRHFRSHRRQPLRRRAGLRPQLPRRSPTLLCQYRWKIRNPSAVATEKGIGFGNKNDLPASWTVVA